jgi:hypothetical protein
MIIGESAFSSNSTPQSFRRPGGRGAWGRQKTSTCPAPDARGFVLFQSCDFLVIIVASKVGQEPIGYVGNIYKYYLAYRRLREIERERGDTSSQ